MCLVFSLFTTLPLSSFPSLFTVFIVLSSVCTGVGWKCLDFDICIFQHRRQRASPTISQSSQSLYISISYCCYRTAALYLLFHPDSVRQHVLQRKQSSHVFAFRLILPRRYQSCLGFLQVRSQALIRFLNLYPLGFALITFRRWVGKGRQDDLPF